ncbi:MAG: hypothetical protein GEU86_22260 [Actinophytocola sp.]|nr:hypothetical protein [Actinophytocola sp.]
MTSGWTQSASKGLINYGLNLNALVGLEVGFHADSIVAFDAAKQIHGPSGHPSDVHRRDTVVGSQDARSE